MRKEKSNMMRGRAEEKRRSEGREEEKAKKKRREQKRALRHHWFSLYLKASNSLSETFCGRMRTRIPFGSADRCTLQLSLKTSS